MNRIIGKRMRRKLLALLPLATTWAHPLGNFTVNVYSRLELGGSEIHVLHIVDMAEIPAFQELAVIDADHDSNISAAEREGYLARQLDLLHSNLHLTVAGAAVALEPREQQLERPAGQGGLQTLRLTNRFVAQLPKGASMLQAEYRDDTYAERIGWREIVVRAEAGARLLEASVPPQDVSAELRQYPQDLLQSPLRVSSASFRFEPGVSSQPVQAADPSLAQVPGARPTDRFAALISERAMTPAGLLLALISAFGLGAAHALSPGHGKTIVAAYLVGTRGTARHALFLGLTTTITHTAGVFGLGLVTLFVSQFILPERLYPWLGVASGLLVFSIGVSLFNGRLRGLGQAAHEHEHDHADMDGHALVHSHGGTTHSHLPPETPGINWRSLLALGVSGGLIPCPSALVVLLSAIALGQVGFGLLLIVAFSLGLASVLTGIGVLLVYAGRLFQQLPARGRLLRSLPVASALLIAIVGLGITAQALVQTGLLS